MLLVYFSSSTFYSKCQSCKKLLGICIDCNFPSEYYINRICGKASQKIYALPRIAKYVYTDKEAHIIQIFQNFTV